MQKKIYSALPSFQKKIEQFFGARAGKSHMFCVHFVNISIGTREYTYGIIESMIAAHAILKYHEITV